MSRKKPANAELEFHPRLTLSTFRANSNSRVKFPMILLAFTAFLRGAARAIKCLGIWMLRPS